MEILFLLQLDNQLALDGIDCAGERARCIFSGSGPRGDGCVATTCGGRSRQRRTIQQIPARLYIPSKNWQSWKKEREKETHRSFSLQTDLNLSLTAGGPAFAKTNTFVGRSPQRRTERFFPPCRGNPSNITPRQYPISPQKNDCLKIFIVAFL